MSEEDDVPEFPLAALLGGGDARVGQIAMGGPRFNANTAPNFLNPEDYIDRRWQLADNFTFTTGTSYIAGFGIGGLWGGMEGIRNSRLAGSTGKIRAATVLNGVTKQGTRAAVSLGAMGFLFSATEKLTQYMRQEDDIANPLVAGGITGGLWRSPGGPRHSAIGAIVGVGLALTVSVVRAIGRGDSLL